MKRIIFISVQPDDFYFYWQVEVFIHNAIKNGINPKNIQILFSCVKGPKQELIDLSKKYNFVKFYFYERNEFINYGYVSALRPDALEQHFSKYPELRGEVLFYHDSDIIFKELPDFDSMHDDNFWYLSDTISYIGANYIKSKSDQLLTDLCDITGVKREIVESNENNSGGAQYLMKGVNASYWSDVKETCLNLYKYMAEREEEERKTLTPEQLETYNPIQKWCSDMWAVLWCAWKRGHQTKISRELGFSWGSSDHKEWDCHKIMHNAGVLEKDKDRKFFKGEFINKSPFDRDLSYVEPYSNSWHYAQAIEYAKIQRKEIFGS
jgi:hypothetical protein